MLFKQLAGSAAIVFLIFAYSLYTSKKLTRRAANTQGAVNFAMALALAWLAS